MSHSELIYVQHHYNIICSSVRIFSMSHCYRLTAHLFVYYISCTTIFRFRASIGVHIHIYVNTLNSRPKTFLRSRLRNHCVIYIYLPYRCLGYTYDVYFVYLYRLYHYVPAVHSYRIQTHIYIYSNILYHII